MCLDNLVNQGTSVACALSSLAISYKEACIEARREGISIVSNIYKYTFGFF